MQRAGVSGVVFGRGRRAVIARAVMLALFGLGYGALPAEAAQAVAQFRVGIRILPVKRTDTLKSLPVQPSPSALAQTTAVTAPPLPRKRPALLIPARFTLSVPAQAQADND
ncbi:hypothetical protein [Thermopetrobacter sp. TC1]|uniref:hypothetical protein n=1 Tax=Thermopetrobacter sp. TC1 TaxID=1495045 RepID=UPI000571357C|nr:hypothetical protein [Thermopetrobacter sp. TC1]